MNTRNRIGWILLALGLLFVGTEMWNRSTPTRQPDSVRTPAPVAAGAPSGFPLPSPAYALAPAQSPATTTAPTGVPLRPEPEHDVVDPELEPLFMRARLEAEAAALRAAKLFREEMLRPVEHDAKSIGEELYSLGANVRALTHTSDGYEAYVARRFLEILAVRTDAKDNLEGALFAFTDRLNKIAQIVAIESGRDVADLTLLEADSVDVAEMFDQHTRASLKTTSDTMRKESRTGALITSIMVGLSFATPIPFLADLVIFGSIDLLIEMYRDPSGSVTIDAHNAAETLVDRLCFGSEDEPGGIYGMLLDITLIHHDRLRAEVASSDANEPYPEFILNERTFP